MFAPHAPFIPAASVCTQTVDSWFRSLHSEKFRERLPPFPWGPPKDVRRDARGAWGVEAPSSLWHRRASRLESVELARHALGHKPKFRESLPLQLVRVLVQSEDLMPWGPLR